MSTFLENFYEYMELKIFVDSDDVELKEKYYEAAINHNNKLLANPKHYDAGFDMYFPSYINLQDIQQLKVDYQIKCCAHIKTASSHSRATAFYTYGRSSISNTSLRLANNQGIIDAGYRGNLMAKFDVVRGEYPKYHQKYSRLMQICAPNLIPIHVEIVNNIEDLGEQTQRGTNGFGSTGI
jgi:dUTPase